VVAVTAVVVAVKDPEEAPAPTMRVAGTLTAALLLESATLAPPDGAAAERVTVQVLLAPPTTDAGAQITDEIVGPLPALPPPLPPPAPTVIEPEVADSATGAPDGDEPATAPSVT
jgi:hypothetical protein